MKIFTPILLSPGPTPIPESSKLALTTTPPHHRTAQFSHIFHETLELLKYIYQTENDLFILTSSGTGAMEAAIVNTLSPGDTVLIIRSGKFGERWGKISSAYGLNTLYIDIPWGETLPLEKLEHTLHTTPTIHALLCQQCETSTGTLFNIQKIAQMLHNQDTLMIVDGISSLGVHPCLTDAWGIDVLVGSSQKALMAPPGLSFLSFSKKAWRFHEKSTLPKFYFNITHEKPALLQNTTAWTPAINLIISLHASLTKLKQESLPHMHIRHQIIAEAVRAAIQALGLQLYSQNPCNALTAVRIPTNLHNGHQIPHIMHKKYNVTIATGQGPSKGKIFRIGHLGYIHTSDILTAFQALEFTLKDLKHPLTLGISLKAIQEVLYTKLPH